MYRGSAILMKFLFSVLFISIYTTTRQRVVFSFFSFFLFSKKACSLKCMIIKTDYMHMHSTIPVTGRSFYTFIAHFCAYRAWDFYIYIFSKRDPSPHLWAWQLRRVVSLVLLDWSLHYMEQGLTNLIYRKNKCSH